MAASSSRFLAEALGEFSLTSPSRPVCLSTADPASDWGGLSQAARGPADWSLLSGLSAGERGILNSSVMLTGDAGLGKEFPECRRQPGAGQSCEEQLVGLEQGDPLSQIHDPQISISVSNCTE